MSQAQDKEAAWKKALCFQTPTYEVRDVGGAKQKFYPISVGMLFKLRRVGEGIIKALALAFANTEKDAKYTHQTITVPPKPGADGSLDEAGHTQQTITTEPISFEMAQYRDDQKSRAWTKALEAVLAEENLEVVGEVIMDSLREVFPRDPFSGKFVDDTANPREFMTSMPLPMLTAFIMGVAVANKDVIGPLGEKAKSVFDLAAKNLSEKLAPEVKPEAVLPGASK